MKQLFLLTIMVCFFCGASGKSFAQGESLDFKNPFEPQLPKEELITPGEQSIAQRPETIQQPAEIILPPLVVAGLVWNTDRPQAIINNQVVSVGDKINDATIVGISKAGVNILYLEKPFTLRIDERMAKSNGETQNYQPRRSYR